MSDHSLLGHMSEIAKDYGGYVLAALGTIWALTVWAFRSVLSRYEFATEDYVKQELSRCHAELHGRIRELETEVKVNREVNSSEHQSIGKLIADNSTKMRDLVIELLAKK